MPRELAGNQFGLAVVEAEPVQQRDQAGMAVLDAIHAGDPCPDRPRAARQVRAHPLEQGGFLFATQPAMAATDVEDHQPGQAMLFIELVPGANRVVVNQQRFGDFLAAPALVQQNNRIGAPRHARFTPPVPGKSPKLPPFGIAQKATANHVSDMNPFSRRCQDVFSVNQ